MTLVNVAPTTDPDKSNRVIAPSPVLATKNPATPSTTSSPTNLPQSAAIDSSPSSSSGSSCAVSFVCFASHGGASRTSRLIRSPKT